MALCTKWLPLVLVTLLAGCEAIQSYEVPNTSAAFEMAVDPTRPFSDRRPAAMMIDSLETSKLKALLMKRIPNGWYTTATNDMFLLAAIGDEGNAEYLEQLYPRVPDARQDAQSMTVMLHSAVAEIRNRMGTHAFAIAADGLVTPEQRQLALPRLTPVEVSRLQVVLLDRIPGKSDANTINDITLLGQFGDEPAAQRLEGIYKQPDFVDSGTLTPALMAAVHAIRDRAAS